MNQHCSFSVSDAATRFLLPFRFNPEKFTFATERLAQLVWNGAPLWRSSEVPGSYADDYLHDFLKSGLANRERWGYFRVDNELAKDSVEQLDVWYPKVQDKSHQVHRVSLLHGAGGGIEVFLHAQGAGVLSITLRLLDADREDPITLEGVKMFNYWAAQHRPDRAAMFKRHLTTVPPNSGDPGEEASAAGRRFSPFRTDFLDVVHSGEQWFPLKTFCRFLLGPLTPRPEDESRQGCGFNLLSEKALLMPYSVVRLMGDIHFESLQRPAGVAPQDDLSAQASVLAQLYETTHPLPASEDQGAIVRVFHTDELMAASAQGAAILLADAGVPADTQKLRSRCDKYFVCFLAALIQRLALMNISRQTATVARANHELLPGMLRNLRRETLGFVAESHFIEISSRDSVNRFYSLCQQAQRVTPSLGLLQRTIADLDAAVQAAEQTASLDTLGAVARHQRDSMQVMAATQSKIEWIEVFIVSFYAAGMIELLGREFHFANQYVGWVALAGMLGAAAFSLWRLAPWREREQEDKGPPTALYLTLLGCGVLFGIYLLLGERYFPDNETGASHAEDEKIERLEHDIRLVQERLASEEAARTARAAFLRVCPPECQRISPVVTKLSKQAETEMLNGDITDAKRLWEAASAASQKPSRRSP